MEDVPAQEDDAEEWIGCIPHGKGSLATSFAPGLGCIEDERKRRSWRLGYFSRHGIFLTGAEKAVFLASVQMHGENSTVVIQHRATAFHEGHLSDAQPKAYQQLVRPVWYGDQITNPQIVILEDPDQGRFETRYFKSVLDPLYELKRIYPDIGMLEQTSDESYTEPSIGLVI